MSSVGRTLVRPSGLKFAPLPLQNINPLLPVRKIPWAFRSWGNFPVERYYRDERHGRSSCIAKSAPLHYRVILAVEL
jgi:hypothetical protein